MSIIFQIVVAMLFFSSIVQTVVNLASTKADSQDEGEVERNTHRASKQNRRRNAGKGHSQMAAGDDDAAHLSGSLGGGERLTDQRLPLVRQSMIDEETAAAFEDALGDHQYTIEVHRSKHLYPSERKGVVMLGIKANQMQQAIIMKEILDKPVSLRASSDKQC